MAHPVYVLLPDGATWPGLAGTSAQAPAPVRWYLRQQMPEAATQTAVLVSGSDGGLEQRLAEVARRAAELGGMALDASTQVPLEPSTASRPGVEARLD